MSGKPLKYPVSALVVLHDKDGNILLIERTAPQGFWQSVTGSLEEGERIEETAWREVWEETGIRLADGQLENWHDSTVYEIYHHWRHRYPKGVFENANTSSPPKFRAIRPSSCNRTNTLPTVVWCGRSGGKKLFSPSNKTRNFRIGQKAECQKGV